MPFVLQRSPPYCLHRRSLKLGSAPTMSTNSKARAPVNHFFTKHLSAFKMSRMTAPSRQYAICLVGNRHTSVHFHLIDSDSGHKCLAGLWGSPCGGEPWSPWRTNSASNTLASFTSIRRSFTAPWLTALPGSYRDNEVSKRGPNPSFPLGLETVSHPIMGRWFSFHSIHSTSAGKWLPAKHISQPPLQWAVAM